MSKKIYLASKSPRRQELLKLMGFDFELLLKVVDETYPPSLAAEEVATYLSKLKADAFELPDNALLITSDTVVILDGEVLGKPADADDAFAMLSRLNGRSHRVITGVTLRTAEQAITFADETGVTFAYLSGEQLWYYIHKHRPFDKAGAYGIQDWIGMVGVKGIKGSYTNVMGLPTEKLFKAINQLLGA